MTMSKLARVLAVSVVLGALSLGGAADAPESGDPPAQAGVTPPATPQAPPEAASMTEKPDPSEGIPASWSEPVGRPGCGSPRRPAALAPWRVTSRDAVRWGRFAMSWDMRLDTYRLGDARFRVLPPAAQTPPWPARTPATGTTAPSSRTGSTPGWAAPPTTVGQGGFDPTRLPLPAGVALTVLGAGLGFRHSVRNRR